MAVLNQSLDRLILGGIVDRRIVSPDRSFRRPCFVAIPSRIRSGGAGAAAVSMSATAATALTRGNFESELFGGGGWRGDRESESAVACNYEKLDGWMRSSVAEIVKNLQKAPLFVNVYASNDGGCGTRLETEEAVAEDWAAAKRGWEKGEAAPPEGVIFVEELRDEREEQDLDATTKAWGVVVQGRGSDCAPACYLLKTCSSRGLGLCCTHFSLVKVTSFRETTSSQLKNCWLMPGLQ